MKAAIIFLAVLLLVSIRLNAQTRTIYGRVISEDLEPVPYIQIQARDTVFIGRTGLDGRLRIDIPKDTQTLLFTFIGFEPAAIKLHNDCDTVEIVMMYSSTYDFLSAKKIDRLRLIEFNKLPVLHFQAYEKHLFSKETICYSREFEPHKPRLDEIHKESVAKAKKIKLAFNKLNVGDTVKIPFSGTYRADGTDRTTLNYYSAFSVLKNALKKYDCLTKCVITAKNRHKGAYNLVCKVVDCNLCTSPSIFRGRLMQTGETFVYNMMYFKVWDE